MQASCAKLAKTHIIPAHCKNNASIFVCLSPPKMKLLRICTTWKHKLSNDLVLSCKSATLARKSDLMQAHDSLKYRHGLERLIRKRNGKHFIWVSNPFEHQPRLQLAFPSKHPRYQRTSSFWKLFINVVMNERATEQSSHGSSNAKNCQVVVVRETFFPDSLTK